MRISSNIRISALAPLTAVVGLILFAAPAKADVVEACSAELSGVCSAVVPGEGRLAACLYAYVDQISDPCFAAVEDQLIQIDFVLARLRHAQEMCAADIQNFCSDTDYGSGQILMCLTDHQADLSDECGTIVERASAVMPGSGDDGGDGAAADGGDSQ